MTLDSSVTPQPQQALRTEDEEGYRTSSDETEFQDDHHNHQRRTHTENDIQDENDDDMTEINVDDVDVANGEIISRLERRRHGMVEMWTAEEEQEYEQRRREHLHQELLRIQRTNFFHFGLICIVPLGLLVLVILTGMQQNGSCESNVGTQCFYEERGFLNAFSRRCVCTGITLVN